jgi:PqqD family protein of HPr-rel-A system
MSADPNSAGVVWQASPDVRLSWASWDSEYVVFDAASGDTHVLDELSAEIFRRLDQRPGDLPDLIECFSSSTEGCRGDELAARIQKTLSQLERVGLIEPKSRENR